MQKGIVSYFNKEKGFGFIKVEGLEKEIFFHHTAIITPNWTPTADKRTSTFDPVTFEMGEDDKGRGPKALKVALDSEGGEEMSFEAEEEGEEEEAEEDLD
jgi:CspA family cold shock protein